MATLSTFTTQLTATLISAIERESTVALPWQQWLRERTLSKVK
jgi:hypothetical protein